GPVLNDLARVRARQIAITPNPLRFSDSESGKQVVTGGRRWTGNNFRHRQTPGERGLTYRFMIRSVQEVPGSPDILETRNQPLLRVGWRVSRRFETFLPSPRTGKFDPYEPFVCTKMVPHVPTG